MDTKLLLDQFVTFYTEVGGGFGDFQLVNDTKKILNSIISVTAAPFFQVIGRQKSGSLVSFWQYQENKPLSEQPVIWLDSEGSPNAVFAPNLQAFLSLLPYDTGIIYDITVDWEKFLNSNRKKVTPKNRYSSKDFIRYIKMSRENNPTHDQFIAWLRGMDIAVANDPVDVIGKAMQRFPNLKDWLTTK